MIRCNNCGWFNLNTATSCEKCGEALDLTLVEEPKEELHEPSDTPAPSPASPLAETEPKLMNKTVRLGEDEVAPQPKKGYGATVLDAGAVIKEMEEDVSYCPKCRYPLVSHPEFCPNCGTTLRRDTRKDLLPYIHSRKTLLPERTRPDSGHQLNRRLCNRIFPEWVKRYAKQIRSFLKPETKTINSNYIPNAHINDGIVFAGNRDQTIDMLLLFRNCRRS